MHAAALVPFNCAPKLFTVGRCYRRRRGVTWSRIIFLDSSRMGGKSRKNRKEGRKCKNCFQNFERLFWNNWIQAGVLILLYTPTRRLLAIRYHWTLCNSLYLRHNPSHVFPLYSKGQPKFTHTPTHLRPSRSWHVPNSKINPFNYLTLIAHDSRYPIKPKKNPIRNSKSEFKNPIHPLL